MRKKTAGAVLIAAIWAAPSAAWAQPPPARPLEITPGQFESLQHLQSQPRHSAILEVHASYKSHREMQRDLDLACDDFLKIAHDGGYIGLLTVFLVVGAPL